MEVEEFNGFGIFKEFSADVGVEEQSVVAADDEVVLEAGELLEVLQERDEATLGSCHVAGWAELDWDASVDDLLDLGIGEEAAVPQTIRLEVQHLLAVSLLSCLRTVKRNLEASILRPLKFSSKG